MSPRLTPTRARGEALGMSLSRPNLLRSLSALLILVTALWAIAPAPVAAQDLDPLRASGRMGERFDGYAEAIDPGLLDFVKQVNGRRNQIYQQRAAEQNVPASQVGRVYAQEIIAKAPSGTRVLQENGTWATKP